MKHAPKLQGLDNQRMEAVSEVVKLCEEGLRWERLHRIVRKYSNVKQIGTAFGYATGKPRIKSEEGTIKILIEVEIVFSRPPRPGAN